jgi:replication initiation protein RepC
METKRQISFYRSQIRAGIAEAAEQGDDNAQDWAAAYEAIATQIRTHIKLDQLFALLERHKALHSMILESLAQYDAPKETEKAACTSVKNCVHNKYSKNKISNKLESNITVLNSSNGSSNGDQYCENEESTEPEAQTETKTVDVLRSAGLQHITLKQAVSASSQGLKNYLPVEEGDLTWGDFIEAAFKLKNELNISQTSWGRGCEVLGTSGAALSVLLADHATQRLFNPIENANAYFCAMIARGKYGTLKLHNSIFGLLKGSVEPC